MDKLSFLDVPEGVKEPVETPAVETPPEPEQAPEIQAEAPPVVEEPKLEQPMVPLAALHEVRDEVKSLKAQLGERAQPAPVYTPAPDPVSDPDGAYAWQQQQIDSRIYQTNLNWSKRIAEIQHGPELVTKALEWGQQRCSADPYFNQRLLASPDPVGEAINEFQRSSIDPAQWAQFQSWQTAQAQVQQQAAPAAPIQQSAPPPVSIASAPSAGGVQAIPVGPGQAFDGLFRKG